MESHEVLKKSLDEVGIKMAAHRLGQAGCDVTILEKDGEVGGTWYENTYPGCRVDVPNHFYSYACFQEHEWPQFFSTQPELLAYFCAFAEREGLRERIRFETEVLEARWDDDTQRWLVTTRGPDGTEAEAAYDLVVSAVGQLNRPKLPDIPGVETFEGPAFHSARWDHSVDLAGKRVAVIGTGASAVQFVPEIAPVVGGLGVFQRTPPWIGPTENYHDDLPEPLRWLMAQVPDYCRWDRLWQFWRMHEGLLPAALVDPDWPDQDRSMSMLNEFVRQMLAAHLEAEFAEGEAAPVVFGRQLPVGLGDRRRNPQRRRVLGEALQGGHQAAPAPLVQEFAVLPGLEGDGTAVRHQDHRGRGVITHRPGSTQRAAPRRGPSGRSTTAPVRALQISQAT